MRYFAFGSANNIQGMEELVKYIYSQGHRKIAYIHGQDGLYVTRDRLASFYRTVDKLGLVIPDEYIRTADYLETKGAAKQTKDTAEHRELMPIRQLTVLL